MPMQGKISSFMRIPWSRGAGAGAGAAGASERGADRRRSAGGALGGAPRARARVTITCHSRRGGRSRGAARRRRRLGRPERRIATRRAPAPRAKASARGSAERPNDHRAGPGPPQRSGPAAAARRLRRGLSRRRRHGLVPAAAVAAVARLRRGRPSVVPAVVVGSSHRRGPRLRRGRRGRRPSRRAPRPRGGPGRGPGPRAGRARRRRRTPVTASRRRIAVAADGLADDLGPHLGGRRPAGRRMRLGRVPAARRGRRWRGRRGRPRSPRRRCDCVMASWRGRIDAGPPSARQRRVNLGKARAAARLHCARMAIPDRPRILFVEDERSISEPFSKALAREGFEPHVAGTAARALELAERARPRPDPARPPPARRRRPRRLPHDPRAARASRSSSSPPAAPRPTASSASSSAPTTTWSSRSAAPR